MAAAAAAPATQRATHPPTQVQSPDFVHDFFDHLKKKR
jgi:hypothetical protein